MDIKAIIDFLTSVIGLLSVATPLVIGFILWLHKMYKAVSSLNTTVAECKELVDKLLEEVSPPDGRPISQTVQNIEKKILSLDYTQRMYWDVQSPHPIFIASPQGKLSWANRAFLDLIDRPLEQVCGTGWEMIVCDDNREHVRQEWYRAFEEGRSLDMRFCIQVVDGHHIDVRCRAFGSGDVSYIGFLTIEDKQQNT